MCDMIKDNFQLPDPHLVKRTRRGFGSLALSFPRPSLGTSIPFFQMRALWTHIFHPANASLERFFPDEDDKLEHR